MDKSLNMLRLFDQQGDVDLYYGLSEKLERLDNRRPLGYKHVKKEDMNVVAKILTY